MIDLSKYDKYMDEKTINEQMKKAEENDYSPVPAGEYDVKLERLEVRESEQSHKLMLSAMYRIIGGGQNNKCMFQNIVLFGTKNDGFMLHQAKTLIRDLGFDIEFENYTQFAREVEEIADSAIGEEYSVTLSYQGDFPRYDIK